MIGDILQPTHLLLILVVALIVLGPKRLPEVGKSLGRGLRDFRNALSGDDHEPPRESLQQAAVAAPQPIAPAQHVPQADPAPQPVPPPQAETAQLGPTQPTAPQAETQPAPPPQAETAQPTPPQPEEEPQPVSTGAQNEPNERSG